MALHLDGSCLPGAFGDDDSTTTFLRNEGDEAVDGFLILGCRVGGLGTKRSNDKLASGELDVGQQDALLDALIFSVVPSGSKGAGREE